MITLFLERLIDRFEKLLGSTVSLTTSTIEIDVPQSFLAHEGALGICLDTRSVGFFIVSFLARSIPTKRELKILRRLAMIDVQKTTHVILIVDNPVEWTFGFKRRAIIKRALRNHERMHALTMIKSKTWHVIADETMWYYMPVVWDKLATGLLSINIYARKLETNGHEPATAAWFIVTELLGRVAAVLHAPKSQRQSIARHEMPTLSNELLELSAYIEDHWGSAEALLGWFDSLNRC